MTARRRIDRSTRGRISAFLEPKRVVAEWLRRCPDVAGGVWIIPTLDEAWHWSRFTRAIRIAGRVRGLDGRAVARVLLRVLAGLGGPVLVWVPRNRSHTGHGGHAGAPERVRARQLMVTKNGGCIAFDHTAERVVHALRAPLQPRYRENRDELSRFFTMPDYELDDDRRFVRETLIPGQQMAAADEALRVAAAHQLLEQCADAAQSLLGPPDPGILDQSLRVVGPLDVNQRFGSHVLLASWLDLAATWPTVLSHGDLTPFNVVLRNDGSPVLLDFEDSRYLPFFYDSMSILIRDRALWRRARAGEFDVDLERLMGAAGSRFDLAVAGRVVAVIAAVDHANRYGGDLEQTLAGLWPESLSQDR